jgi:hypothetical protein
MLDLQIDVIAREREPPQSSSSSSQSKRSGENRSCPTPVPPEDFACNPPCQPCILHHSNVDLTSIKKITNIQNDCKNVQSTMT